MQISNASKKDREQAMAAAKNLKDWFTDEGLKNMRIDFDLNNVAVAKENGIVVGFLCYTAYSGKMLLLWMGVQLPAQRKGVGQKLLQWLENEGRKLGCHSIEVETLPDEDDYEPYRRTRSFYYTNGFERIFYKKARVDGWDDHIVLEKKI
ncbi:MAG: GNAT family N-acetyltransferase [Patescibacteria group bacterium]